MIDRIVHHADVITLEGSSYRLKDTGIDTLPSAKCREHDTMTKHRIGPTFKKPNRPGFEEHSHFRQRQRNFAGVRLAEQLGDGPFQPSPAPPSACGAAYVHARGDHSTSSPTDPCSGSSVASATALRLLPIEHASATGIQSNTLRQYFSLGVSNDIAPNRSIRRLAPPAAGKTQSGSSREGCSHRVARHSASGYRAANSSRRHHSHFRLCPSPDRKTRGVTLVSRWHSIY
jgi:hypothetical protein